MGWLAKLLSPYAGYALAAMAALLLLVGGFYYITRVDLKAAKADAAQATTTAKATTKALETRTEQAVAQGRAIAQASKVRVATSARATVILSSKPWKSPEQTTSTAAEISQLWESQDE